MNNYQQRGYINPYMQQGGQATQEAPQEQAQDQAQGQGGAGSQQQQIMQACAQMLQQGMKPQEIVQKLIHSGIPQQQAVQIVQVVMQQMQQGQQDPQQQAQQQARMGKYYR